ncbi:UNKNOWN [Stylonychia lemnae]|uniref:NADP-dependent oxidoreductase domain-containing protein n=1 Tax=Stylonychia lemnae TaxID=5949 RepID=A0A078AMG9_STYLE|nr:UNKNOWN [Stylonychia lemnae]|eukprot:CDW83369.1 UNKNOWN [Stylonychia lemnae]
MITKSIAKLSKSLLKNNISALAGFNNKAFSSQNQTTSQSESEDFSQDLKQKIDPLRNHVNDFLRNTSQYEDQIQDVLMPYYFDKSSRLAGHCSEKGTDRYYRRSQTGETNLEVHPENFKYPYDSNLKLSSIGYGTYIGDPDDLTDYLMYDAIKTSVLSGGLNVIDTSPNYRYMKSEKTVGKVLTTLDQKYGIKRDELFVASKVGYVPEDAERMISAREAIETLIQDLKVPESEIVKESGHCLNPIFLKQQLENSLERLNLQSLDLYYLHNPYEAQGPYNTDNVIFDRITKAFEFMEQQVQAGKIRNYGLATYSSFRVKPSENKMHLSLEKIHQLAEKVGGKNNHFKYIQVPINVMMPEAFVEAWQPHTDDKQVTKNKILLGLCNDLQLNVISSQPLLQGYLAQIPLSRAHNNVFNIPARHLQFVRSIPSKALKSSIVGMKRNEHVRGNLEVVRKALMKREEFFDSLKPHRRQEFIEEELDM